MSEAFADVRDLYQEVILQHSRHPKYQRRLDPFDGAAKGDNPMCGDRVEVRVRLDDGRVAQAGFEARGCAISVASADLMAEAVAGQTPAGVQRLAQEFRAMVRSGQCPECSPSADGSGLAALRPLAGVHEFPSRLKCATLPWDALIAALGNAQASETKPA